jgi:hypothetical protein
MGEKSKIEYLETRLFILLIRVHPVHLWLEKTKPGRAAWWAALPGWDFIRPG